MIGAIHLTSRVRTSEDFGSLIGLLSALGLAGDQAEEYGHYRVKPFRAPTAGLDVVYRKDTREYADLELFVSDPDSTITIIRSMGLEVISKNSNKENGSITSFQVLLAGGTRIEFTGVRVTVGEEVANTGMQGNLNARAKTFAIVVARFNSFITERLLAGAIDGLLRSGAREQDITIVRVPGSFEIPSAARTLAETKKYDAIICLGCLLRGDTAHYDVIVNEVTRGIGQSSQETGVPHAFGVLTCETLEQAIDRAGLKMGNKGFEAALSAVEMANLKHAVRAQHSPLSKTRRRRHPVKKRKG
jgi:6,7-dimethyl-8-ribityllumazine synthase